MGEHMSGCSINNIAPVVDVRRVINIDSRPPSNELEPQLKLFMKEAAPHFRDPFLGVPESTLAVANVSGAAHSLAALLTSFFTRLLSLVSDKQATPVPVIPAPTPTPQVTPPLVVTEPVVPNNTPSVVANIPGLSSKQGGAKPDNIWSGFRQGPDGNCVTVSAIKAAMYRFGQSPTDIYKQVTRVGDGYRVVMRDGFQLTLTDSELAEAARSSKFIGRDHEMLKDAHFLFAVSAKRAQMENNDHTAGRSYQAAIRSLNDGEDEDGPGEGFLRLGLRQHMRTVPVRDLARGQVGMCNRRRHSVAVINGREELWGRPGSAPVWGQAIALV